jgi:hypothetical protein
MFHHDLIVSLLKILQHVDPLLIITLQTSVARQQIHNTHQRTNWEAVSSTRSMRQLRDATIELLGDVFLCSPYRGVIGKTIVKFSQL